ncbi:MAG: hypothetical protein IPM38_02545 [Ignavibacteria bacterium]|nr:hypothetical protein [Ignavibacteria bacterium]
MKKNITTLVLIIFILTSLPALSQSQGNRSESVSVDGLLKTSEWSDAKVFTDFYKFIPKSDEKNYDSTIVYIKQTKDAVYFGFDYFPKGKIISKSLTRDRSTEDENEFFILLDLENKNQNGYMFAFSFLNNQRDAVIYNQRNQSSEWDWVWEVKSKILVEPKNGKPGHIQTEVRIPVDKLQNKNTKSIGVDVQMFSYTPDGNYYYYSITPNSDLLSLKNTHKLDLTTPFDEKLNVKFDAIPILVGQSFNDKENDSLLYGIDVNASIEKHKLKATYNPDESTLEADPFRFSLYSRPIFLQEKRPFFSKDLDIYRTPINLFYTRAIEDIRYGFNYTYRSDNLKAGAVFVDDHDQEGNNRQFLIARPNVITKNFNLGSLFIFDQNSGLDYNEKIVSMDGFYRFPENRVRLQFQVANSWNENQGYAKEGAAYNFYGYYEYNNAGGPFADVSYRRVNKGFNAVTSFNNQIGLPDNYDEVSASGGYYFVFDRPFFSDINVSGGYYKGRTLHEDFLPADFNLQNNIYLNSNFKVAEWLRFGQYIEYNRPNDFNSNDELITRYNLGQEYNASFFIGTNFINAGYFFGPYFGDFIKNPYLSGNVFLFERLALSASVNFIDLSEEKRTIINTSMNFKVIDKLYLKSYFQRDNYSKQALWNSILQYEFFAGSNVYFVINLNGDRLQNTRRYFKIGYEFGL